MISPWMTATADDATALGRLSAELRAWDPAFDLVRPPADALLFEPDGTLYALALDSPAVAEFNHRRRALSPGDLLIVPRAVPVGVEPIVDLLGLRFEGSPPDHFRERFIQVWGYDYFPGDAPSAAVAEIDLRFPIRRTIARTTEIATRLPSSAPLADGRRLVVALEGRITIAAADDGRSSVELAPREVLLTDAAVALAAHGPGLLAVLRIEPEAGFEVRRATARRAGERPTPEHLPPPPQSSEP